MYDESLCLICGGEVVHKPAYLSEFVVWRTSGTRPLAPTPATLAHCASCDFHFSTTRFDSDELFRLYDGYRNDQYNQQRLECEPNYQPVMYSDEYVSRRKEFINSLINKHAKELTSILDYGGDDGTYVPEVPLRCVYDVSGRDPLPGVLKYHLNNDYKFDLVMNCQVLEHVSNMDEILTKLKHLTKQYLYIEVPAYRQPPPEKMTIGEHINFFNKRSLHQLLNKHEIAIVDTQINYDLQVLAVLGRI